MSSVKSLARTASAASSAATSAQSLLQLRGPPTDDATTATSQATTIAPGNAPEPSTSERKPAPSRGRPALQLQDGTPGVLVLSYDDLRVGGGGQTAQVRNMRLPTNTFDGHLQFVNDHELLGGEDMFKVSMVFRQEKQGPVVSGGDKGNGVYGIDYVVLSYMYWPDGEQPEHATWEVPTYAHNSPDVPLKGEIVGYCTYGWVDCANWDITPEEKSLLRNCLRLSQVIMKRAYSQSVFDRVMFQMLNQYMPECRYVFAEPIPPAYRAYMEQGIRWKWATAERLQPLPKTQVYEIFGDSFAVYREEYCATDTLTYATLVFPVQGLSPTRRHRCGFTYRVLPDDHDDELEIVNVPRNVDKTTMVETIYKMTGTNGIVSQGLTFVSCRRKRQTVTQSILHECFGEPWEHRTINTHLWESQYLPPTFDVKVMEVSEARPKRDRTVVQRMVNEPTHLSQKQRLLLPKQPPVEPAEPPKPAEVVVPETDEEETVTEDKIKAAIAPVVDLYTSVCQDRGIDPATLQSRLGATKDTEARMSVLTPESFCTLLPELGALDGDAFTPSNVSFVDCGTGGGLLLMLAHTLKIHAIGFEREYEYLELAQGTIDAAGLKPEQLFVGDIYEDECFRELAKLIPTDYKAVVWIHNTNFKQQQLLDSLMRGAPAGSVILTINPLPLGRRSETEYDAHGRILRKVDRTYAVQVDGYEEEQTVHVYEMSNQPPMYDGSPLPDDVDAPIAAPQYCPERKTFKIGDRVAVRFPLTMCCHPATVTGCPSSMGFYNIEWDDGDTRFRIANSSNMFPLEQAQSTKTKSVKAHLKRKMTVSERKQHKRQKKQTAGAKVYTVETVQGDKKMKGPRTMGCALDCFYTLCHTFKCMWIAHAIDEHYKDRAKNVQLSLYKVTEFLTDMLKNCDKPGVHLSISICPPVTEVPIHERLGGAVNYALNQVGVFILVTTQHGAKTVRGMTINHAILYIKLGNTKGATGAEKGMLFDPHRKDNETVGLEPSDFAKENGLRDALDEYMGYRTEIQSAWRVKDTAKSYRYGFYSKDPALVKANWKRYVPKQ